MKINLGNSGYATPQGVEGPKVGGPDTSVSEATARLGGVVAAGATAVLDDRTTAAEAARRKAEAEAKAEAERVRRQQEADAEAMSRLRVAGQVQERQIASDAVVASVRRQVSEGQLPWQQVSTAYQQAMEKVPAADFSAVSQNPLHWESGRQGVQKVDAGAQAQLAEIAAGGEKVALQNDVAGFLSGLEMRAGSAGPATGAVLGALDSETVNVAGRQAYGAHWEAKKAQIRQNAWTSEARGRLLAADGDPTQLAALARTLGDGKGFYADKTDPDTRILLANQALDRVGQLQRQAAVEGDKREAAGRRALDAINKQNASGLSAPAEVSAGWLADVKGTPSEPAFRAAMKDGEDIRRVLNLPPDQQQAEMAHRRAEMQKTGGTLEQQANLDRLGRAVTENAKLLRDSPLDWVGTRTGQPIKPIDLTVLMQPGGATALAAQLNDRMDILRGLQKAYGPQVGLKPFLPGEVDAIAAALPKLSPYQQGRFLGDMVRAFGADTGGYQAALAQIAPTQPVLAFAGMVATHYGQRAQATSGGMFRDPTYVDAEKVVSLLLRGQQALTAPEAKIDGLKLKMPTESEFRQAFDAYAGNAFAGQPKAATMAMQALRAYYVGASLDAGDLADEMNPKRLNEALRVVLGQSHKQQGSTVFAPFGMSADEFDERLGSAFEVAAKAAGVPENQAVLSQYGLRQASEGTFLVTTAGGREFLRGPRGPVVVRLGR